jgi:hypothetical protein
VQNSITLRYADGSNVETARAEARAIFAFLVRMHKEGVGIPEELAPLDHDKALLAIYDVVTKGHVIMAYDGEQLVGVLGVVRFTVWYSQNNMLSERFFYIEPSYRDGPVMRAILRRARDLANEQRLFLQLTISNFHKDRPARSSLERIGDVLSYFPRGSAYQVAPAEKAAA